MYSRVWFSRGCDCSINVHCCNDISVCREENDRIVCIKPVTILLTNFLCDTSYLTHLVPKVSWEQYLTIKHPLASNTGLVTEAHLLITSASAWFFSLVLQIPLSIHPQVAFGFKNTFIVLSPVTTFFCHFTVHHEVRRHQNEISQQVAAEARLKILLNRKSLQLTATVALVLFLCYTPLFLYRFILVLHRNNTSPEVMYASILISPSFAISNSLFNPFIHVARLKEFRIAFIELLSGTAT